MTPVRIAVCLTLFACASTRKSASAPAPEQSAAAGANPFFEESPLSLHYPPFDKIHDADYAPAFEAGMAEQLKEVQAIAHGPAQPTFENTFVALEKSGRLLRRVQIVFNNLSSANTDPEMQKIEAQMAPRISAHRDEILLDPALFARVDSLYQKRGELGLDPESRQLVERYQVQFVRAGAKLSPADKEKLKKINKELSSLTTKFRQNTLKSTKENAVVVDDEKELDGLSKEQIGAAAEAAKARKLSGKYVLTLQNTTQQPPLRDLTNRGLRERLFKASVSRGVGGDADNASVVARILALRAEKAKLFGDANWAAYTLEEETAGTPQAVNKMLGELAPPALAKAKKDAQDLQALMPQGEKLEPWDWEFYAQKLRKQRYDFDEAAVKPYFELNRVIQDGVFYAANQLYGITFKERHDLPVYQPEVRVWDVIDADGSQLGIFVGDYYKRDNKQGGAWMNAYVPQSGLFGEKPVVANHLNIPKPPAGQPTLLTFEEVTTAFHEFGHALHGLFNKAKYPLLSGSAPRDWVEFPSQFNETWTREPKVLANIARHYQTGEPMPKALLDKVKSAENFDSGFKTSEYLEAAILDQSWHQLPESEIPKDGPAVASFDDGALQKDGVLFPPVPPRYHTAYFSHIFSSGYSAAYYAYIWSEVLARDSGQWFYQHGGMTRANGDVFRARILSRARTEEPRVLFEKFYGGPPRIEPLLEWRGLAASPGQGR
ncbi:MAG: M3 family metallopeptidase [Myxococcales bacterium]|nr:M3 family metallopeptidase [Myxococcales bacterium]